jgi:UDP-N-acetyl-D-mannosaminuronic acid dehydrogenase
VREINEMAPKSMFERSFKIQSGIGKDLRKCKIFIIGFAFKGEPETSDLRESTTLWFLDELKRNNAKDIWGYDPVVKPGELKKLNVKSCSLPEGFQNADAVFFLNNHHSYSNMNIFELIETMNRPALFFDGWQIFIPSDIRNIPGIIYAGIGVG